MGFRFRKSVKAGPFRMTFSKSGVGYSVGGKGFRVTKKAGGGVRTTTSIPNTGISYVKDYSNSGNKKTQNKATVRSQSTVANNSITSKQVPANMAIEFYLCLFLGWAGVHKFYRKKIGWGLLYLFTLGLLGIGWLIDIVKTLVCCIRASK